ncbi:hypothetical protein BJ508DRAFT_336164 [Ascobolus immersus RN42]|uniref:Uncharacterized protein n=1 Tax=Ascobolus immersus RN42 TaxID=1160509 RepID=A0A3N4H9G9_ASCIM|nr:hypothetical protein BJ508DRAFT_336164 [Ascobolus immersus RN42]
MSRTNKNPRSPLLLRLPNELLGQILIYAFDDKTYLAASVLCCRLRTCALDPYTRKYFTKTWFATYCNDEPQHAPSLIKYMARYNRAHRLPRETKGCVTRYVYGYKGYPNEDGYRELTGVLNDSDQKMEFAWASWVNLPGTIPSKKCDLSRFMGRAKFVKLERICERIAELEAAKAKFFERSNTSGERLQLSVESVGLDVEDVAFGVIMYRNYRIVERKQTCQASV